MAQRHIPLIPILVALCCSAAFAAAPAVKLQGAIKIDGNLDDPAWATAEWQSSFLSASAAAEGAPRPVAVQTRFKVLYDDDALYVGLECDEPDPGKIVARYTEHDQDVYGDDCVELFMDPAGEGRYYHHFVINTNGAWYDDYAADYGLVQAKLWECPLQTGAHIDAEGRKWSAEVRIPFAALALRDDVKQDWLWNVTRERYAGGSLELSTWSPLKGNFHAPRLFGKLTGVNASFDRFNWAIAEPQVAVTGNGSGNYNVSLKTRITNNSGATRKVIPSAGEFLKPDAVKAEPIELAPGASADIAFGPLTLAGDPRSVAVQVTLADAVSGVPYTIAVKRLNAEYQAIAVQVLKPVYRQNIYATESIPDLVFRVTLARDVADKTAQVVFSLHDEQDRSVREGKARLAALSQPLKLEVGKLPCGRYTLKLRAADRGNKTVTDYATVIRKLPAARGSEVRIDEKRNIVVNGEPRAFIGWYGDVWTEDPRPDVVALQNVQTPVVLSGLDVSGVHKTYQEHGIYSIVSIEPGRMYYTFDWWRDPNIKLHEEITKLSAPSDEFLECLKRLVGAVKDEPGLLAYYLADEPEINNARSDYMEAMYAAMQELDPYHPVVVTNDTLDGIVTHGYRTCDILSPDPYSDAWDYVPNFMKRVLEVASVGKATIMTPWQSCGQTHFTTVWGTAPPYPYKVMRNQYLVSVALGCRGWTGYTSAFFIPEPVLRYGLPAIWREVRFLEPAMANPQERPKVEADAEMASWLGEADGKLYLIVVNHKPGTRTATISHPRLADVKSLDVTSEGRTVRLRRGSFTDRFKEGDVRIYTTDPAGRRLPTTAEVEKDLAAREAACVKPGNLLHSSLGVRASSSEGYYAPWFTQYYYYAINGVIDDLGWTLSHTDKPGWLELTLPQEKKIGRVTIYTPNLQDYDLELKAADGSAQIAEIRGSQQTVVEHNFIPALPTLKLRITARMVRGKDSVQNATVAEIEAYEQPGQGAATVVRQEASAPAPLNYVAPSTETAGQAALWREDFTNFRTAPEHNRDGHDDKWVLNRADLFTEPKPDGGLVIASTAAVGYAGMTHLFPYDKDYRYFQVKLSDIEQKGYRWAVVNLGSSSGKPGYRGGVHALYPGVYTVDTHYVHDSFRNGEARECFIVVSAPGSEKQADGTVGMGARFTYDYMQLVRRPQNGLIVALGDGSPLPASLKEGDTLMYRLFLDDPAMDVTVEALGGSSYQPIPINGEPYVQLRRAGAGDGREWAAQVALGGKTGKVDGTQGYPVMFRAVITGGSIPNSMMTVSVAFE